MTGNRSWPLRLGFGAVALAAALFEGAAWSAPRPMAIGQDGDVSVSITSMSKRAADGTIEVGLGGKVLADEAGYAGRSFRMKVLVACGAGRDRVLEQKIFASPDWTGAGRTEPPPAGWIKPAPKAFLSVVNLRLCGGASIPKAGAGSPRMAAPGPDSGAAAVQAVDARNSPPLAAPPAAAFGSVAPPFFAPVSTAAPDAPQSSIYAREMARSAPAPMVASNPRGEEGAKVKAAPGPAPDKVVSRATGGVYAVQIAALSTQAAATAAFAAFAARLPQARTLDQVIEHAQVAGKGVYRARLHGFASLGDAKAFCSLARGARLDCFVAH